MTTQREATWWMVAAMAVIVGACVGTGCQSARTLQSIAPTVTPADGLVADMPPAFAVTATAPAPGGPATPGSGSPDVGGDTAPAARPAAWGHAILGLPRVLSLATPWHTTQELITSAVTRFHAYPPQAVQLSFRPEVTFDPAVEVSYDVQPEPLYDALSLRDAADDAAASFWNLSLVSEPADPWAPRPSLAALRMQQPAKFDGAGLAVSVLGAMLLLFGGEAVVLWVFVRRPDEALAVDEPAVTFAADPTDAAPRYRFTVPPTPSARRAA